MRSQSKDSTIKEAAQRGVKLWRIGNGYFSESADTMAKRVGVTAAFIRQSCAIHAAGLGEAVIVGELSHTKAYKLSRIIHAMVNDTDADSDTDWGIKHGE